jgi:hypothetical protein
MTSPNQLCFPPRSVCALDIERRQHTHMPLMDSRYLARRFAGPHFNEDTGSERTQQMARLDLAEATSAGAQCQRAGRQSAVRSRAPRTFEPPAQMHAERLQRRCP